MDKESDSEEDTIPRIDPRSSDEHSEDDEHHNPSTTRGRCAFLQYLPSKPDKYGIKIFWICNSENGFPLHGDPYLRRNGQKRETNVGRNTATALASPCFGSGRNLTVDNFFTNMELSAHLLANNMTLVGTVRRNKRFLPQEFQTGQGLKKGDAIFGCCV
ncbi:hypothetical protein RRG08_002511 [Elysia crispata]|uniref:PiggyBac transposable element-derived protein domain-containing protein n=1 Tax=Elysia crispata TaxID=231223 RepID=A0AAE1DTW3_9GAST|nr:hypothetical protein RRG08_002511 [Elysia crispata]